MIRKRCEDDSGDGAYMYLPFDACFNNDVRVLVDTPNRCNKFSFFNRTRMCGGCTGVALAAIEGVSGDFVVFQG